MYITVQDSGYCGGDVRHLIYKQFLHANLKDVVKEGSLEGLDFMDNGEISGTFLVQVCS